MPLSTISAVLKRQGMGRLGRLGLEPAPRYERDRPGELIHIDVKKLGRIQGGAGKRITGGHNHYQPTFTDRHGKRRDDGRLGVRPRRDRRRHPPGLRRSPARRESRHCRRVPRPRDRALRPPRHPRPARPDRQRLGLPVSHPRARLPRPRHPPSAHPAARPQTNGKACVLALRCRPSGRRGSPRSVA